MNYEVELKFAVDNFDAVLEAMQQRQVQWQDELRQVDQYYAHPQRDFAETDEALRIRTTGSKNVITYKGPKLDAETKTREEIELPLAAGREGAEQFGCLLTKLGFKPVARVAKTRRPGSLRYQDQSIEVALDRVDGLGTYVELEVVSSEDDLDDRRRMLLQLAADLELGNSERRGYLEMLLEAEG